MKDALAERKPRKLFGKKKPQLTVVQSDVTEIEAPLVEPIDMFSQSLKQEILLQDDKIEAVLRIKSDNISIFQGPRVLDWNKSTGRVALAESVIKDSETQFLAFRRQMEIQADMDGCGGRNETSKGLETSGITPSNIIDFGRARLNKALGISSSSESGRKQCEHNKITDECEKCKDHKH